MDINSNLLLESLVIGIFLLVVSYIFDIIFRKILERLPKLQKVYNNSNEVLKKCLRFFFIGFIGHMIAEVLKINRWTCKDVTDGSEPLITMKPAKLVVESVLIGMVVLVIGMVVEYTNEILFLDENKNERFQITTERKEQIKLFAVGFFTHLFSEQASINKWQCSNVS